MSLSGTARNLGIQAVHYFRKTVNFDDIDIGTGVKLGTIPANARIIDCMLVVETVFNAGTTNVLTVGTSGGSNADVAGSSDVTEGTVGAYRSTAGSKLTFSADTDINVMYTQTGTAATTGKATVMVAYCPDN